MHSIPIGCLPKTMAKTVQEHTVNQLHGLVVEKGMGAKSIAVELFTLSLHVNSIALVINSESSANMKIFPSLFWD